MLATCAIDKTVALWDTLNVSNSNSPFKPIPCGNKDMNVGKLYCVSFYQSSPWLLGCGGSGNQLALWNLESEDIFKNRFGDRVIASSSHMKNNEIANTMKEGEQQEQGNNVNSEDFEAIIAANDQAVLEAKTKAVEKKKKGKSKKKVHKKR